MVDTTHSELGLPHQSLIKKTPQTYSLYGGLFSVELLSSQVILPCVKPTKTSQHMSDTKISFETQLLSLVV